MASMAGRAGEPRAKYVHTVEHGLRDQPTVLNNVETWANVPPILEQGRRVVRRDRHRRRLEAPWDGSSGTKVFSLVGKIRNTGLVEVPMGITLREIIFDIGGGIPDGRHVQGGADRRPVGRLPARESLLDLPVDFDTLTEAGSMMGSGGMIVMDDRTCMVDVARYFVDFLVRRVVRQVHALPRGPGAACASVLTRIAAGEGQRGRPRAARGPAATVLADGSLCGLGQIARRTRCSRTLRYFRDEYEAHIREQQLPGRGLQGAHHATPSPRTCTGCTACVKACPTDAITGERKKLHVIDQDKCIKCGTCFDVCKYDAVQVR